MTVAGTGNTWYEGNGLAMKTNIEPRALAFHPDTAELFFSDGGGLIRKMSADGQTIETVAGTGVKGTGADGRARLTNIDPGSIAFDPKTRDLYFVDSGRSIRKLNADGQQIETVNLSVSEAHPLSLAFDPKNGDLYYSDSMYKTVLRVSTGGSIQRSPFEKRTTVPAFSAATYAGLDPRSLAFDRHSGKLYFSEGPGRFQSVLVPELGGDGSVQPVAGTGVTKFNFDQPVASANIAPVATTYDQGAHELYFSDHSGRIRKLSSGRTRVITVAGYGVRSTAGNSEAMKAKITPESLAFHPKSRQLYFADWGSRIRVYVKPDRFERELQTMVGDAVRAKRKGKIPIYHAIVAKLAALSTTAPINPTDRSAAGTSADPLFHKARAQHSLDLLRSGAADRATPRPRPRPQPTKPAPEKKPSKSNSEKKPGKSNPEKKPNKPNRKASSKEAEGPKAARHSRSSA